jgi:23S rRNA (uracil1939-C5)-methyltransferase
MQGENLPVFTITIDKLVYGGDGMGRLPDGRAVFVPFTLPGEMVMARLVEEKRGHARAELVDVLVPSPVRIEPRCPDYEACGGCHYQHMSYETQLDVKRIIVRDQLERLAGLPNFPVEFVVPSKETWNYRNHIQLHVSPEGKLGYQFRQTNQVVPLKDCTLAEPPIDEIWPQLEVDPDSGLERVGLRLGAEEEILLVLEGSDASPPEFSVEDLPLSAVYLGPAGEILLAGSNYLEMEVRQRRFKVSARSFFQVNTFQAENLVEHVLGLIDPSVDKNLLELYSGVGLFSAFLAPRLDRLSAVESSPWANEDFGENLDEFDNVELYEASVEEALPAVNVYPDIVLTDPPRAGMGRRTLESLVGKKAKKIVYVSCDPATLARDAKTLVEKGYILQNITPFDMFPQTFHIETVSLWLLR